MTDNRLHVKPAAPGMGLRDPRTKRELPDEGGSVPDTVFWRRRLLHGDVVEVKVKKSAKGSKAKAEPAKSEPAKAVEPKVAPPTPLTER